ncbi:MAG: inositol monophosphatase [Clostridiales bacterium]|nr:inositol monophosphatase [Clostridiales bacterium]
MGVSFEVEALVCLLHQCKPIVMDRRAVHNVTEKGLSNYVTEVDLHVQEFLWRELHQRWPEVQLLSEEQPVEALDFTRPCWILDPIDGTANLIHDFQESSISLALWDGEALAFGGVYNPFTDELFHAAKGQGAYLNGTPIHVSNRPDLIHSLMIVGTCPYHKERAGETFDMIRRVFERSEDIRRGGSAALELCKVACGRADGFVEFGLKPWDYAGGAAILLEAGGAATDFEGSPLPMVLSSSCAASNGIIHDEVLEAVRG